MRRKAIFLIFLLLGLFGLSAAAAQPPIPVAFEKAGGGQWLYCNNPEFVKETDLSSIENPEATYLLKNEALGPDNYSLFYCFYNWNTFDVEADV